MRQIVDKMYMYINKENGENREGEKPENPLPYDTEAPGNRVGLAGWARRVWANSFSLFSSRQVD